jgi:hypothetical protein
MKSIIILGLLYLMIFISSCSVVEGIFKAGVWVGILAVALIIGLILYFVGKARK